MRVGLVNSYYYGRNQSKEQSFSGISTTVEKPVQVVTHPLSYLVTRRREGIQKLIADCKAGKHNKPSKPSNGK